MSNKKNNTKKNKEKTNKNKNIQEETEALNVNAEKNEPKKEKNKKDTKKGKEKEKQPENITASNNTNNEMVKLLKIVLIVTGIMLVFYGITIIATKKADEKLDSQSQNEETTKTEIQYDNIMIGSMLNHPGTYYVLIKQKDDNRIPEYESLITTIKASEDAPTIYMANLTDSFNKKYLGKEQNYYVDDLADFKVTGTTLVKIKDGKIDSVSDSHDAIKNKLNDLA